MAARRNQSLVLEISANMSQLDTGMKAARSVLAGFKGDIDALEAEIKKSFAEMGGAGIAGTARQAEREFNKMFRTIAANAQAIKAETSQDFALQLFDVGAADEQVRALTMQAGAYRLAANAAVTKAAADGDAGESSRRMAATLFAQAEQLEQQALALDQTASEFRSIQVAIGTSDATMKRSTEVTAQKRAALQQLGFQVNDVATQFASGTPVIQIFGQQVGQVSQAIGLMNTSSKGFAAFMAGPWGVAITAGVVVLAALAGSLWDTDEASDEAKNATIDLSQQFDFQALAADELRKITDELANSQERLASMSMSAAKAAYSKATADRDAAQAALDRAKAEIEGLKSYRAVSVRTGGADAVIAMDQRISSAYGDLETREANIAALERRINGARFRFGTLYASLSPEERAREERRGMIEDLRKQYERNGDPALLAEAQRYERENAAQPDREPGQRGGRDRPRDGSDTAERAAREAEQRERAFQNHLQAAQRDELQAKLARARTVQDRNVIEMMLLGADLDQRRAAIVSNDEVNDAQRARLLALHDSTALLVTQTQEETGYQRLLNEQLDTEQRSIDLKLAELEVQMANATTLDQRRAIALQLLELEEREKRAAAERLLKSNSPEDQAEGRRQIALLDIRMPQRRQEVGEDYEGPFDRYKRGLERNVGDMNTALDQVRADGLAGLEDGLVEIISGTESVAGAFKKMANAIIADLVRIAVQKLILNVVSGGAFGFLGFSEGGPVQKRASGGFISGPGTATSDSIPALLSNGEFVVRAAAVAQPGMLSLLEAINGRKLPRFANGGLAVPRLPSLPSLGALAGGRGRAVEQVTQVFQVNAQGAITAADLLAQVREIGLRAALGGAAMAAQQAEEQQLSTIY